jgi:hypothetical protein
LTVSLTPSKTNASSYKQAQLPSSVVNAGCIGTPNMLEETNAGVFTTTLVEATVKSILELYSRHPVAQTDHATNAEPPNIITNSKV